MSETDPAESVARSLLGTKWKPRVIRALAPNSRLGFGDLQHELEGVSSKVLSANLEDLLEHDVITRDVVRENPRRVEYELTAAGRELDAILESMAEWDDRYVMGDGLARVLLADDDVRLLEMYSLWLSAEYDVVTARNGRKALARLDDSIDAAILDRNMPELTGDEVAKAVVESGQQTPIAFLTSAQVAPEDVSLPADRLLRKPVTRDELQAAVAEVRAVADIAPIARAVDARRHRLEFVERYLGSSTTGTDAYKRAQTELEALEDQRAADLETRQPWRRYLAAGIARSPEADDDGRDDDSIDSETATSTE